MGHWVAGFVNALSGMNLLYLILGTLIGLVVGILPGLGPLFGVAMMLPFTFSMEPETAIIFLCAIHATTVYADSITSILLNTPGGVGSIASCWDGYPMARQGKPGMALGISAMGSFLGGVMGWASLVLISPLLLELALKIGPAEYFSLGVLALSLLAVAGKGETLKGLIMGGLGLILSFVGQDPITGRYRFSFGSVMLEGGLAIVPVTIGLFAISQALFLAEESSIVEKPAEVRDSVWRGIREVFVRPVTVIRSGILGILIGIMPALGTPVAVLTSYMLEKQSSKHPETFGRGNPAGLVAPEVAKNACVVGDLIPAITLGIPGSAPVAILMAALVYHGVRPGFDFFARGDFAYTIFAGILCAQVFFCLWGIALARYFGKVLVIPKTFLVYGITILCVFGTYASNNSMFDVLVMLVFGLFGYVLRKHGYPPASLVLGFVLGPIIEPQFHRALLLADGSYSVFLTRPLSLAFLVCALVFLMWNYLQALMPWKRARGAERSQED